VFGEAKNAKPVPRKSATQLGNSATYMT
jgi:hypothetical protein